LPRLKQVNDASYSMLYHNAQGACMLDRDESSQRFKLSD
jgi:hypothetical protein